jgi:hypothetical protein
MRDEWMLNMKQDKTEALRSGDMLVVQPGEASARKDWP